MNSDNLNEVLDIIDNFKAGEYTERYVDRFRKLGFTKILDLDEIRQSPEHHPEGNVGIHTRKVVSYIHKKFFKYLDDDYTKLFLAGLLHDVGKIDTYKNVKGKISFIGHDKESVKYAAFILGKWGFGWMQIEEILYIIENHMRITNFKDMGEKKRDKFLADKHFHLLLKFHEADCMGSSGDLTNYKYILDYMKKEN